MAIFRSQVGGRKVIPPGDIEGVPLVGPSLGDFFEHLKELSAGSVAERVGVKGDHGIVNHRVPRIISCGNVERRIEVEELRDEGHRTVVEYRPHQWGA